MNRPAAWKGYAWAAASAAACTAIGYAMTPRFDPVNIAMVYLLGVVLVALREPRGPAIAVAVLSVAAFDFCFVPPQGSFTVHDGQYLLTFAILVVVALVIQTLVERTRRQARDAAALEIAAETERIRSTLLASISHDLRTPLAVLAGGASQLAEQDAQLNGEERRELAQRLFAQTRDLSDQVAKILQMTRLEAGAVVPARDWSSLQEIAGAVLARLRDRLAGHRVMVELPASLPLVRVDAPLIEQAMGNLLENAAQHTPAGTPVRLRAEAAGNEIVVSVEDFGAGMPDEDVERVFAKFHQGAAEGKASGAGLGLAICRAIVRLHGGRAWAEQMPGGGAAFRFSLPAETPPPAPAEAA